MEYTTHFVLQSQATRLTERIPGGGVRTEQGYDLLRLAVSTTNYTRSPLRNSFQTTIRHLKGADFHIELIPLHSPLLRESLLVSFPPLNNMFKFSGYPYLRSARRELRVHFTVVAETGSPRVIGETNRQRYSAASHKATQQWNVHLHLRRHEIGAMRDFHFPTVRLRCCKSD